MPVSRRAALLGALASSTLIATSAAAAPIEHAHERIRRLVAELSEAMRSADAGYDSITVTPDFARQNYRSLDADGELVALGARLQTASADLRVIEASGCEATYEATFDVCNALVRRIEQYPATTVHGLRVKAKAVAWCHWDEEFPDLSTDQATTDLRLANGILRDLLTMEG